MQEKPIAIVLGGTVPHFHLIRALQKRGFYVILIDYHENPPASLAADTHIQESTMDREAVLNVAKETSASLVISGCVDQANVTACYVAEELSLPAPYSYQTALRVTDKALMKEGLVNGGVPTALHEVVTLEDISRYSCGSFPKVVKPCDCNGSKGVRKVHSQRELMAALEEGCMLSRSGKALVENFNEGIEVNGYYFIARTDISELYIKRKSLPLKTGLEALQSFISIGPETISSVARSNLASAVAKIAIEFGLENTPLLVQANIDNDDVKVIEFAPRVGGGLAFREIQIMTGFDLISAVIDSYLHQDVDVANITKPKDLVSVVHLYASEGKLGRVEGMEKLLKNGVVEEFHVHKTPGMSLSCDDLASRNRVMGAILRATSVRHLDSKLQQMVKGLRILSNDGRDVFNRELFSSSPAIR